MEMTCIFQAPLSLPNHSGLYYERNYVVSRLDSCENWPMLFSFLASLQFKFLFYFSFHLQFVLIGEMDIFCCEKYVILNNSRGRTRFFGPNIYVSNI